jgi:release factor H-coupled RctB family protein
MALWQTELPAHKTKLDRWVKKLRGLESPWGGDVGAWLDLNSVARTQFDGSLGTIGGGNHFAELQAVEQVDDHEALGRLGLAADCLLLLVHSGSRGLGEAVLRKHIDRFGVAGVQSGSDEAYQYLLDHRHAIAWAQSNRRLIAHRFLSLLGTEGKPVLDLCHNSITQREFSGHPCWLHRKGASPSDAGPVVIPGSRGTMSYLVEPLGEQEAAGFSVAHGAGRKWARSDARGRLEQRYSVDKLRRTELGGHVICDDKDLLYEEAPQAYKNIDIVIQDLVDHGLVRVIARFRPLITYKTRDHDR